MHKIHTPCSPLLLNVHKVRKQVQLTQLGQKRILNPNCYHLYGDRVLPVDQVLRDALAFLKSEDNADEIVEKLINLRLEQYAKDISQAQQESSELDNTDYQLMGALLVRYDSSASEGNAPNAWCLYLRDYMNSEDGNMWRVILKDNESTVSRGPFFIYTLILSPFFFICIDHIRSSISRYSRHTH